MNATPADTPQSIEAALAAIEARRALLGDAVVDAAVGALQARLAQLRAEAAMQQLKQVTLLFCDVVGSTRLSERLDPEEINAVMDGALARFSRSVAAHHGLVLQYAGDNVLAVFGAPVAREDDAECAVHAALAILRAGSELGAEIAERHGFDGFDVRVGLHTGGVLLGGGVDGEHSVRGIAVNVAARMEQSAPPGAVRISLDTWRQVRGRFDFAEQPPLAVKGVAEPLRTFLVLGLKSESDWAALRGVEGVPTPLVGRAAELARLQAELGSISSDAEGGLRSVTVVADAGLGKSRLAAELRATGAARWLEAHASEQGRSQAYGVLRQWLVAGLDLRDSDAPALAREHWLTAAARMLARPADAAVLGHLIGFDFSGHAEVAPLLADARQLRDRAFFHAGQWLQAASLAPGGPLLLLLDDLHWADDGSLDFIEHLAIRWPALRLMLLALTRPSFFERRPAWSTASARRLRIDLIPLDAGQSGVLADALLGRLSTMPLALRQTLVEQAEGNPFYMEELVNMLIDRGVIVVESQGGWRFEAERWSDLPLPKTLVGVLQARLDALPADARRTAQPASVVGFRFWDASLVALGAPMPGGLQDLVDRDLARALEPSSLEGLHEYAFRHHLAHQVIYDSVLKRVKRELHAKVAQWLTEQPGDPPLELIADHYERGGQAEQALAYWQRAAAAAAGRYANAQALAHVERALKLARPDDLAARYALVLLRCRVLEVVAERDRLGSELETLHALALELGDASLQSEALRRTARNHFDTGQVGQALELAQRAVACTPRSAPAREANARALVVQCLLRQGRRDEARAEADKALATARSAGDLATEALLLNELGMCADDEGDYAAAVGLYRQALAQHRSLGNRANEGGTLVNLAYAAMMLGAYEAACEQFEQALELMSRIGSNQNEAITRINLAMARLALGDLDSASLHAERAASQLRATRDAWAEAAALRVTAQVALAQGRLDAADSGFAAACEMFERMAIAHLALEARCGLAEVALARGQAGQAQPHVDAVMRGLAAGVSLEAAEEPLRMLWTCHRVLVASGDSRAAEVLAQAKGLLQTRASRIGDPVQRTAYLERVPAHRALSVLISSC